MVTTVMDDPQPIGAALRVWAEKLGIELRPPERSLEDLHLVPPTDVIEARLPAVRAAAEVQADQPDSRSKQRILAQLAQIERDYADALRRDAIQAARPDGCHCLGAGGFVRLYAPPTDPDGDPIPCWDRYCLACPEGLEQEAQSRVRVAERRLAARAARVARLWGAAGIPPDYADLGPGTYPFEQVANGAAQRQMFAKLERWQQTESHERGWLLMWGGYGVGKTAAACWLLRGFAEQGLPVLFRTAPSLLAELRASFSARRNDPDATDESSLLQALIDVDVLVLDDVGSERWSGWVSDRLYLVLNERHNRRATTILTSNLGPEALQSHVGERIYERIKALAHVVHLQGQNLRDVEVVR